MKEFFDQVRKQFGTLSQPQVEGFNALLQATQNLAPRHRAYILATSWHETATTMQPIHERGPTAYFNKYEPNTKIGKALGNVMRGDGFKFRGRGYVQITGRRNYALASKKLGNDFLGNPERLLDPVIAAKVIVLGMTEGWFTGRKLADFATYQDMRRVVNGVDDASLIAAYAVKMEHALSYLTSTPAPRPEPHVPPVVLPEAKPGASIAWAIITAIGFIIAAVGAFIANWGN